MTIVLEKMVHEMRGVLLVIMLFMISSKHKQKIEEHIGVNILLTYIHLSELAILFDCWSDPDSFTDCKLKLVNEFITPH